MSSMLNRSIFIVSKVFLSAFMHYQKCTIWVILQYILEKLYILDGRFEYERAGV